LIGRTGKGKGGGLARVWSEGRAREAIGALL
jgi:hypothetical protein